VMTLQEAADYLHCHCATIYRLAGRGEIPCFKLGSSWRFLKSNLDEWIVKGGRRRLLWLAVNRQTRHGLNLRPKPGKRPQSRGGPPSKGVKMADFICVHLDGNGERQLLKRDAIALHASKS
jgi:excisionase family DNA binding protein